MTRNRSTQSPLTSTCSTLRRFGLTIALAAVSLTAAATASQAFTADQQRLCTGDAFRLCGSEIPNIDRITMCMRQNRSSLSQDCKSVFDK